MAIRRHPGRRPRPDAAQSRGHANKSCVAAWVAPAIAEAFQGIAKRERYASASAKLREMIELEVGLHTGGKRPPLDVRKA